MPITEEEQALRDVSQAGSLVQSVVNSPGWTEVIKPALENQRLGEVEKYKIANTLDDFRQVQAGIAAIDSLINVIEVTLDDGKKATDELNQTRTE